MPDAYRVASAGGASKTAFRPVLVPCIYHQTKCRPDTRKPSSGLFKVLAGYRRRAILYQGLKDKTLSAPPAIHPGI